MEPELGLNSLVAHFRNDYNGGSVPLKLGFRKVKSRQPNAEGKYEPRKQVQWLTGLRKVQYKEQHVTTFGESRLTSTLVSDSLVLPDPPINAATPPSPYLHQFLLLTIFAASYGPDAKGAHRTSPQTR
jgi:hypothetical protein